MILKINNKTFELNDWQKSNANCPILVRIDKSCYDNVIGFYSYYYQKSNYYFPYFAGSDFKNLLDVYHQFYPQQHTFKVKDERLAKEHMDIFIAKLDKLKGFL